MRRNVGGMDRSIRIAVGVVIILLGIYFKSWWGLVGLAMLLTAVFARCPAYLPFGCSTLRDKGGSSAGTGA